MIYNIMIFYIIRCTPYVLYLLYEHEVFMSDITLTLLDT